MLARAFGDLAAEQFVELQELFTCVTAQGSPMGVHRRQ